MVLLKRRSSFCSINRLPEVDERENFPQLRAKWERLIEVRDEVLKALEEARNAKTIGKSLEAKVTIYADQDVLDLLNEDAKQFAQSCIVSQLVIAGSKDSAPSDALVLEKTAILIEKADGEKCERCWSYSESVGQNENHPTICSRCAEVIEKHYV